MKDWRYRVKYLEDGKERLTGLYRSKGIAEREARWMREIYNGVEVVDETDGEVWRYSDGKKIA